MLFEFSPDDEFSFIKSFARQLDVTTNGDALLIPEWLGSGAIRRIDLAPDFQLMVHHYRLREELILKRVAPKGINEVVRVLFNIQQHAEASPGEKAQNTFTI